MKKQQWQTHVKAYNSSGLSKREYADSHKLVYHQFVYWSQKFNKPKSPNAFIPVNVTAKAQLQPQPKAAPDVPLGVLEYPNGARLVIHSPELLALLPSLLTR
ncbi:MULTISPECIES: IS66 family insertion sequence element accessory protein TnpA [Gammaproteobacteria]|jgi:hypothetical protein|uniref:Transposase n=1 Tax=Aliiglaciecola lipolytica E3 TaxID=1127673 RepID=K6WY86_9ALTE|nr:MULTISPECIES: hypothetical protein [Gammaproteobacteria]GAC13414.1 hypothetical protein GLIP_0769 [Aliiglaciecola lipolytica E3]